MAFCTEPILLDLMALPIHPWSETDTFAWKKEVEERLRKVKRQTPYSANGDRVADYMSFATLFPYIEVRGRVCWFFDIVLGIYLATPASERHEWVKLLFIMAELAYAGYDAPKKYDASGVLKVACTYLKEFKVSYTGDVATTEMRFMLRPLQPYKSDLDVYKVLAAFDVQALSKDMGRIWLPSDNVILGEQAGAIIAQLLFEWPTHLQNVPFYSREAATSPILEITKYLLHKWHGLQNALDMILNCDEELIGILRRSSRSRDRPFNSLSHLMKTPMP